MTVGEKIRALRIEKGVTQEELGRALRFSPQAVSKWENNAGNPDITLIAPLCHYFGISADELCGVETERIREIFLENEKNGTALYKEGKIAEHLAFWREAAARYPGDHATMSRLMWAEIVMAHWTELPEGEERDKLTADAVRIGEKILADCRDEDVRSFVRIVLVPEYLYGYSRDPERAAQLVKEAPDLHGSKQFLLRWTAEGEESRRNAEELLLICLRTAADLMEGKDFAKSPEEVREAALEQIRRITGFAVEKK